MGIHSVDEPKKIDLLADDTMLSILLDNRSLTEIVTLTNQYTQKSHIVNIFQGVHLFKIPHILTHKAWFCGVNCSVQQFIVWVTSVTLRDFMQMNGS